MLIKVNKCFIQNVFEDVIERFIDDEFILYVVLVDYDIKGVLGFCDIFVVIIEKIKYVDVFVGDFIYVVKFDVNFF